MKLTLAPSGKSFRTTWIPLMALTVLGAGLRFYKLDVGLWLDEIVTLVETVRLPIWEIIAKYPGNNHHPLYSVLAHGSISLFGEHTWSLRLPAVLFGIASIPLMFFFSARITTRMETFAATALLTISYHHIWFSQNARGYSALLFWALLASYLLLVGLKENKRSTFLGYGVISAFGIYTHLTMVFVVLSHVIIVAWHLLRTGKTRVLESDWGNPALGFAITGVLSALFYAPLLVELLNFIEVGNIPGAAAPAKWALWETLRGLQIGYATVWGMLFACLLFFVGCWSYFRQSPTVCALFLLPGPIILAAAIILQRPIFPRFFFFLTSFALLLVVRGAVTVGQWIAKNTYTDPFARRMVIPLPVLFVAGLMVLSVIALPFGYRFPKQDYEGALRYVEGARALNEAVAVLGIGASWPYQHYYRRPWPTIGSLDDLQRLRATKDATWVLLTLAKYIRYANPELLETIRTECNLDRYFRGTVSGGGISVYKCDAD